MSDKKGAGRPCKIDQEMIKEMRNYMVAGMSLKDACSLLEIDVSTWRRFEEKNPDYRRKRLKWQKMLKARAKMNIAKAIAEKNDISLSVYMLNYEMKREEKKVKNSLTRARAKKVREEAKIAESQAKQLQALEDSSDRAVIIDDFTDEEVSDHDDSNKDEDQD
ncbi:hypothetical protein [Lactobacillus crispatus]|uniref:hypothetical protein n=1 Tax=Lactobacillus crispatus TaxID=47770 RepID=UPI0021A473B5|nr:hypothetical protein [Lactobacillus crispatus]MCT3539734.1 hypothetical protein [Lactobacillus crispatus]